MLLQPVRSQAIYSKMSRLNGISDAKEEKRLERQVKSIRKRRPMVREKSQLRGRASRKMSLRSRVIKK